MSQHGRTFVVSSAAQLWKPSTRRSFLKMLGVGGTIVLAPGLFEACDDSVTTAPGTGGLGGGVSLDLRNDVGILNYAYALEQLEAAFYIAVVASAAFSTLTAEQQEVMSDLRNHEVIHREFLKAALGAEAIGSLTFNQSVLDAMLTSGDVILRNAEAFEDLGVSAYNGVGKYLSSTANLTLAGKIVSVEARHAAAIRDIRDAAGITGGDATGTRFAGDTVVAPGGTTAGLDVKLEPSAVISRVGSTGVVSVTISSSPLSQATPDAAPPSPTP